jgi:hypothetical protein
VAGAGATLEAGAGSPDPPAEGRDDAEASSGAGDTARGALTDGCDDVAVVFGAGRACGEVQPASTTATPATASGPILVVRQWAWPIRAVADVTTSLWTTHMTNP